MTMEEMPNVGSFTSTWGLWNVGADVKEFSRLNCLRYIPIVSTLVPFFHKSEPWPRNLSLSAKVGVVVRDLVAMVPIAGNLIVFMADLVTSAVRSIFSGLSGENSEGASDVREAAVSLEAVQKAGRQEFDVGAKEQRSPAAAPIPGEQKDLPSEGEERCSPVRDEAACRIEPAAYHPPFMINSILPFPE